MRVHARPRLPALDRLCIERLDTEDVVDVVVGVHGAVQRLRTPAPHELIDSLLLLLRAGVEHHDPSPLSIVFHSRRPW